MAAYEEEEEKRKDGEQQREKKTAKIAGFAAGLVQLQRGGR